MGVKLKLNKKFWLTFLGGLIVVASAFIFAVFLSLSNTNPSVNKLIPAALVGNRLVSFYDLKKFQEVSESLQTGLSRAEAVDRLFAMKKQEVLARKLNVYPTFDRILQELKFYTKNRTDEYQKLIAEIFGGDEKAFLDFVIVPRAVDAALRIFYNGDKNLNRAQYEQIQELQRQIVSGGEFAELAKKESADKESAQFGGDLGFFGTGDLVPELEEAIFAIRPEEQNRNIIISRFGYHLVFMHEMANDNGTDSRRASHILVETTGFDDWIRQQTRQIRSWRLLR